jgi:phosphoribosylglycinamide formyltransferase 1
VKLGLLASHRGSGVQAVVDACASGRLAAVPRVVISNNADAEVLTRARRHGIPSCHLSGATHPDPLRRDGAILDALVSHDAELVVLTGYLKKLGPQTLRHFAGRVLNIHPALLPKFGGQGMYGRRVHEAVLAAGEHETGVTIHLADDDYDRGRIIAQCRVPVLAGDTVDSLAERVLEREHVFLVETLARVVSGALTLP